MINKNLTIQFYISNLIFYIDIAFVKKEYDIDVNDDIADAIGIGHAFVHHLDNEINWG